ncbi:MAG: lysophospholipid acyltransferase family protein [Smithella sp.]|nr:lysophospholipid acyltransferase family protein [Smithella sp.]MDM7985810.1 lysophospholipid acyltransferase family protein [Smithella sp.]HOU52013.1 lysophospholipid acyltransferase family protein [Smithella sp.]HQG66018.1 lysophospholipid acyltransferase family protein [Smithella sp.]HQH17631.1 lysophospholipid acyltransferase family protein [Smithella sp.]
MPVQPTQKTKILLFIFHCIPRIVRKGFFLFFFYLFYLVGVKNRLITLHNLQRSFPEKSNEEILKIARRVYRHFAIVTAEFFDLPYINRANIHKWVEVEGLENYQTAIAQGKGLLTIVAHFGNWELMTIAIPFFLKPIEIVYRPLDNKVIDNVVEYVRTVRGNSLIPKGGSGKKIIELLKGNHLIGILSDQNVAKKEGVFVDFFGRSACTGAGLAVMAMRSGAPVLPIFMARKKSDQYKFIIKPAVQAVCTDNHEADLVANTQRFTKIIEDVIREYPDQYFWFHQRWKTKPWQK